MIGCISKEAGYAALLILLLLCSVRTECPASAKSGECSIVLITIDTLRADHLSCYGYHRKTSPTIDGLAAQGVMCRNLHATSSWTAPSMVSLFTSVYPINHGVVHGIGYARSKTCSVQETFSPELVTLAEALLARGYTTFGAASNLHLNGKFGFDRGFDYFACLPFLPADKVNETVYAWEAEIKQAGKYFLWVHYFDPHNPYTAREPWVRSYAAEAGTLGLLDPQGISLDELTEEMQRLHRNIDVMDHYRALYDSEINYVDAHIGSLIERLKLDRNALIIITSDHGEEFQEHGDSGHGKNLFEETVRVPLVMKLPDVLKGSVQDRYTSLIDVMPTILDMMHVTPPSDMTGRSFWKERSLLIWLKESVTGSDRDYSYSELDTKRSLKTIFSPPWKYIHDFINNTGQLYNLETDPGEVYDLAGEKAGVRDRLRDHMLRWAETTRRYPTTRHVNELSPEIREQLKGLGYL